MISDFLNTFSSLNLSNINQLHDANIDDVFGLNIAEEIRSLLKRRILINISHNISILNNEYLVVPKLKDLADKNKNVNFHNTTFTLLFTKHQSVLSMAFINFQKEVFRRKSLKQMINQEILSFWAEVEKEETEITRRKKKERLNALKSKNYDEYLKLISNTKNERIDFLLKRTNAFSIEGLNSENTTTIMDYDKYYDRAHKIKEELTRESLIEDCMLNKDLYNHQITGVNFLNSLFINDISGILADDMGLGKTVQVICFLKHQFIRNNTNPALIIVPLSTISHWEETIATWAPNLKYVSYYGNKNRRDEFCSKNQLKFNICLTTYNYVFEQRFFRRYKWSFCILDEATRIKNKKSKMFNLLTSEYKNVMKILLTGTPVQNSLGELWALLNFILPNIFNSCDSFEDWFSQPFTSLDSEIETTELTDEERLLIITQLHFILRPYILRRTKDEILDLPKKDVMDVITDLSESQKKLYQLILDKSSNLPMGNLLMQLRKVCNHPYLFEPEYTIDSALYRKSGKLEYLDRVLPKLVHFGHKILLFSQMVINLDILEDYCILRGLSYYRLDGRSSVQDRAHMISSFNRDKTSIFMLSTRAGCFGINLQSANTVIIYDSDFNPQNDIQAQDRCYRIGQTDDVRVLRLFSKCPVDFQVLETLSKKLVLSNFVIDEAGLNDCEYEYKNNIIHDLDLRSHELLNTHAVTSIETVNKFLARSEEESQFFSDYDRYIESNKLLMGVKHFTTYSTDNIRYISTSPIRQIVDRSSSLPSKRQRKRKSEGYIEWSE